MRHFVANNLFQSAALSWMPEIRAAGRLRTAIVQNHDTHDIHASHDHHDVHDRRDIHESGNTGHHKHGTSKNMCIVMGVQSGPKTTVTSHGLSLEECLVSVEN
jgi:hypothetical protein